MKSAVMMLVITLGWGCGARQQPQSYDPNQGPPPGGGTQPASSSPTPAEQCARIRAQLDSIHCDGLPAGPDRDSCINNMIETRRTMRQVCGS